MELSISKEELQYYIARQLEYRFPDRKSCLDFKDPINRKAFNEGLERIEYCYRYIAIRGYSVMSDGVEHPFFNHLNSDQYSQFLYFFSNSLWKNNGDLNVCNKLILLNRDLFGWWFSYKAKLPQIFCLVHPVGSVLGNRNIEYSDYLVVLQNVTINGNEVPLKLGKYLFLGAGAKIIGGGAIGNYVSVGANALVKNPNIPDNSIIFHDISTGKTTMSPNKKAFCFAQRTYFKDI